MSCQGKPIEMQDLRTAQQKQMMEKMGPLIWDMMSKGATPTPPNMRLTQPPDQGMLQAMNMMSMVGGQGPYQAPGMQTGPYPPPPGMNLPPWDQNWTTNGNNEKDSYKEKDEKYAHDNITEDRGRGGRGTADWKRRRRDYYDPYSAW